RDEKRLLPAAPCCPNCGGSLSYLGEDTAEQLELMRSAFRVIRPEEECCPACGGELSSLGCDVSEQLELISSAFKVIETQR
ncbi:IS66 family transposase zinc-finger binding domain-containing protein, partial [Escherichia coli]|uniref:IS66 family transposase zinc-finger binding domain-containing protein n=1 Tax=Escherichia coli TaxID=562 RepID=UPI00207C050F